MYRLRILLLSYYVYYYLNCYMFFKSIKHCNDILFPIISCVSIKNYQIRYELHGCIGKKENAKILRKLCSRSVRERSTIFEELLFRTYSRSFGFHPRLKEGSTVDVDKYPSNRLTKCPIPFSL